MATPATSNPEVEFSELENDVNAWVAQSLASHEATLPVRDGKIVRDAVHGFLRLHPHEIALVDTPVFQRLRYIHQTGLAYLVYPGMSHTRFDHSLGVAHVAERMLETLRQKHSEISAREIQLVRLAGLIHDLGHTVFSHLGENVMDERFSASFDLIKRVNVGGEGRYFEDASSGEILSYLIATSPAMQELFDRLISDYAASGCELKPQDLVRAAGLVVGRVSDPDREQYLADIINGSFDADKLDYIPRDCHFSGIRAEVDLARIIQGLDWVDKPGWERSLTVDMSVAPQLEQLLMSKMLLTTSVYHHHKVRTLEAMVTTTFRTLVANEGTIESDLLKLSKPVDFLNLTDPDFLVWGKIEPSISDQVEAIMCRRLNKRALVLNRHSVTKQSRKRLTSLRSYLSTQESRRAACETIFAEIPCVGQTSVDDLWVDLPNPPTIDEEATQCWVTYGSNSDPIALAETFPTKDWVESYVANKRTFHFFYSADLESRRHAADALEKYLREDHRIEVTTEARMFAHL